MNESTLRNLFDLYFVIRGKPGWIADCIRAEFTQDEILFLEALAYDFHTYAPKEEANDWAGRVEKDGGHDVYSADTDEEKIQILSGRIADIYREYERSMWADEPYANRAVKLELSGVDRLEKLRNSIRGRQLHTRDKREDVFSDRITDLDIERARAYPLEKLIPDFDLAKYGYTHCLWHEDKKPSMLVKNGFGYCFSCAASCDSIKWLMEVDHLTFVDAIKYLRSRS